MVTPVRSSLFAEGRRYVSRKAAEGRGQAVMVSRFERNVEAHIPALRRYARALQRNTDRADDLLQDSLERALSRSHIFVPSGSLRGWLFRIMRNVHLNNLRAASRRGACLELDDNLPGVQPNQIPSVEVAETLAAFDALSVECREALGLVIVEGFSYREAGRVLGVPAGTVMSRVARAREDLRARCQQAPDEHRRIVK
jgi:RNA polymerase sigma-70 factor (ECF subfamily)